MNIFFLLTALTALTIVNCLISGISELGIVIFIILAYSCLLLKIVWGRDMRPKRDIVGKSFYAFFAFLASCLCVYMMAGLDFGFGRLGDSGFVGSDFMIFFSLFALSLYVFLKGKYHVH